MRYTDQTGYAIELPRPPRRIVSLVPSQSELLYDLGLAAEVVGITKFCELPERQFKNTPKVGGTKRFDFERIGELAPELVVCNKEENYKEGVERLRERYPVWTSDVVTLEDALRMIQALGEMTGKARAAVDLIGRVRSGFAGIERLERPLRVLYLIWRKPYMAAGLGTFINEALHQIGLQNACRQYRYPKLDAEAIRALDPDCVFLSSEPFPFKAEKHGPELREICPNALVEVVDGRAFSWYGSRLAESPAYFDSLLQTLKSRLP